MEAALKTKELILSVKPETKSQCQTLPKLSSHIFKEIDHSELQKFNPAEPLPVGVWFFYNKDSVFIEFLSPRLYSKERVVRLTDLCLKYKDFSIFIKSSDSEEFVNFLGRCKIREDLETHFSQGKDKLSVMAERLLSSLEDTSKIKETDKFCRDLTKATLVTAAENKNVLNALLSLHTIDNSFISHSLATSFMTAKICKELEATPYEMESIVLCALLHDLGYFYVEKSLLYKRKTSLLSGDENREFMAHTSRGKDVIDKINSIGGKIPTEVGVVCSQHHERFNGTGYPNKLKGTQENRGSGGIHFYARVISLADEFCDHFEMTKDVKNTIAHLNSNRDYFDPLVFKALTAVLVDMK